MDSTGRPPAPGDDSNNIPRDDSTNAAHPKEDTSGMAAEHQPTGSARDAESGPSQPESQPEQQSAEPTPASASASEQPTASQTPLDQQATQVNGFASQGTDQIVPGFDGDATADEEEPTHGDVADWPTEEPGVPSFYIAPTPSLQRSRFSRRRRRYIFYLRHSMRSRSASRTNTLARLAWASAIVTAALVFTLLTATVGVAASYYQSQVALINNLNRTVSSHDSVRIYDSKGVLLYQFSDYGAQHSISLANVPLQVVNATVAIEDRSFWVNQGVDFQSIVRAAVADLQSKSINQGGSTITQQLIKQNVLNSNETFDRKIREAILSIGMTSTGAYTKSQILEMYLNSIPYGQEAYGIDAAATAYFGYQDVLATGETAAQQLDLAQASMLAGIPQNPNTNNPLLHPQAAANRQAQVLSSMVTEGYITQAQATAAQEEAAGKNFFHPQPASKNLAPHFVNFVEDQLSTMLQTGQLHLTRSGLNVYTTLDIALQDTTQKAAQNHLYGDDVDDYIGHHFIRNDHLTNAAGMVVDGHNGEPGAIRVMLGSVDYNSTTIDGQFNVVTQGFRGPGSSFKPIVYATAFSKGWFPGMSISDMPTIFWDNGADKPYAPLDFTYNEFWGNITVRTALQNSLNIPAVKVMQFAGVNDVRTMAMRMGITQWPPTAKWGLSSVLGTLDVTPYEMVQAYSVFANYGQYIPLHAIEKITDSSNQVVYYQYSQPRPIQVMSPQVAFLVTAVLTDNFTRARDFGACSPLFLDASHSDCVTALNSHPAGNPTTSLSVTWPSRNAYPAGAKTGTGNDFEDDWTLGYTMDYVGGFWGGNNDHTPMIRIDGITGAAPIWHAAMIAAEHGRPATPFPIPTGVQKIKYTSNGITSTDWIISGVKPPSNIGNSGPNSLPCITFTDNPNMPWQYSGGGCEGSLTPNGGSPYRP